MKLLDIDKVRQDFPILNQRVNEHDLVYFDNAATSQKPQVVIDATTDYYTNYNANVHRGVHHLAERATLAYEDARTTVQHFLHAKDFREIIFLRGVTEAANLVAHSFLQPRILPEEEILITEMEHHSNIVPWMQVCRHTGANLRVAPITDEGELDIAAFERLINPKTKFVAITHISNALGTINPLRKIIEIAHAHGAIVFVDGAQAGAHSNINVQELGCDFYAISGHKMYGPTGIGALYGRAELLEQMVPYQTGGEMVLHVSFEKVIYQDIPHKFEAGTPNIVGAIGLAAAINYLNNLGMDAIAAYENELLNYATTQLHQVKDIGFIGSAANKASIINFVLNNIHAHDIGTVLNSLGIAVRSGHHCAIPVMDRYQVPASTRASMCFYNTKAEVDRLVTALGQVATYLG